MLTVKQLNDLMSLVDKFGFARSDYGMECALCGDSAKVDMEYNLSIQAYKNIMDYLYKEVGVDYEACE